jgi:hypothetical protein
VRGGKYSAEFEYHDSRHDKKAKEVLGLRLLGQPLSATIRATIQKQGATGTKAVALLLGSPEFQRR